MADLPVRRTIPQKIVMPEEKQKIVAVKFTAATVFNSKVHAKDAVLELPEASAELLIKGKHAEPHKPAK
jgi:hypothetical protein